MICRLYRTTQEKSMPLKLIYLNEMESLECMGFFFFVKILQNKEEPAIFFWEQEFLIFGLVKWNSSYDMKAFISLCLCCNRSSCEPADEDFKTCHCWSCLLFVVWGKLTQLHAWKFSTFVGREGQNPMWICAAAEPCADCVWAVVVHLQLGRAGQGLHCTWPCLAGAQFC